MSHSLVLVVIDLYTAIPCLCNAKVWVINVFKCWEHQMIKQIYEGTIYAIPKSNKAKTKIVMQG